MISYERAVGAEQTNTDKVKDRWCLFAIFIAIFARFWKTIILAKPISLLFLVSVWDSLFFKFRTGQSVSIDPSLIELHLPYRFFVADCWRHAIPLWNELSGFGMPLLADPQAFVLSPLLSLFYVFPSTYVWNMTLIIELAVGAFCTYLLCRELEMDHLAALAGSLLFSFCPWSQWQLELLGNGTCLTPFVFLFFVRAAKRKSLWNASEAGVAAAIDILSAHPENSFATIGFASLLLCLVAYYQDKDIFKTAFVLRRISISGIVAFGLSSPMLIPFGEYLCNGETYKFAGPTLANISLEALLANYLFPFFTVSSPFYGPLSWFGVIALASFPGAASRYTKPLLGCFALSVLAVTKLFPLSIVFGIPPFSAVQSMYFLPEYLLLLSIVSALGLNKILCGSTLVPRTRQIFAFILFSIILLFPLVFLPWHHNNASLRFDPTLAISGFNWKLWFLNACFAIVMMFVWVFMSGNTRKPRTVGRLVLMVLGVFSLAIISYRSLPVRPAFQYPNALPINIITENGARFISLGDHLFRPNTNLVYKLLSPRVGNPLFPRNFIPFMKACGAEVDEFSQHFTATINRMLDLTGTRTILSEQPLLDEECVRDFYNRANISKLAGKQITYTDLLTVNNVELFHDRTQEALFCRTTIMRHCPKRSDFYHLNCEIKDDKGSLVSFIEPQPISGLNKAQVITFSAFEPKNVKYWTLSLKLISDQDSRPIQPSLNGTSFVVNCADGTCLLATSKQSDLFANVSNRRFGQAAHFGGSIVAYENKTALNRYFLVSRVEWVKRREDALLYLKSHGLEASNVVVIDDSEKKQFEELVHKINASENVMSSVTFDQSGHISKLDSTKRISHFTASSALDLQVQCPKTSLLVVSDLYYPGWKVYLDDKDWQMFRGDYLFRMVPIPPGVHRIRFEYQPVSFATGLGFFIVTVTALLIFWFRNRSLTDL